MKPRPLSQEECSAILSSGKYGRLCLSLNNQPYVVPVSYVYTEGLIYLHSRSGGKKVEYAKANPTVCFQVDLLTGENWSSVVAYGTVFLRLDAEAKMNMFKAFIRKGIGGHDGRPPKAEEMMKTPTTIWEIRVREMTGREGIW